MFTSSTTKTVTAVFNIYCQKLLYNLSWSQSHIGRRTEIYAYLFRLLYSSPAQDKNHQINLSTNQQRLKTSSQVYGISPNEQSYMRYFFLWFVEIYEEWQIGRC